MQAATSACAAKVNAIKNQVWQRNLGFCATSPERIVPCETLPSQLRRFMLRGWHEESLMKRLALALVLAMTAGAQALAADSTVAVAPPAKVVAPATTVVTPVATEVVAVPPAGTTVIVTKPEPHVPYGCKRVWRCDQQVCEWRRGCWGIYGYMEGPYYSQDLAQRQWERDGWPVPGTTSSHRRKVVEPSLAK